MLMNLRGTPLIASALFGVFSLLGANVPLTAQAKDFPTREVELVVPFSPGGSTDAMARIVAPRLSENLGVPVTVVNKPGGAAVVGTNYALSEADGHRIMTGGNSNLGPVLAIGKKAPYTLDDVAPLARGVTNPMVIVAKKGRFENFAALVREAKEKPGSITFASWGSKSPSHFYGELLAQRIGAKLKHIAFEGGAKAMVAAMGGHVDLAIVTVTTAKTNIQAGTLEALAVTSETRAEDLPDIPSMKDLGIPGAVYVSFDGFAASAKIPADRLTVLRQAFEKSLTDSTVQAELKKIGSEPAYLSGPEYQAMLRENLTTLRTVAANAGIED